MHHLGKDWTFALSLSRPSNQKARHLKTPMRYPVTVIVIAQLLGTSLWFSANSAADDLIRSWAITPADIGTLTNGVQLGFIVGTLLFALTGLADRFAASRIFAVCAVLGAGFNLKNAVHTR